MDSPPPLPAILFEDPHLIVLNKPAGVPTQSTASGEPGLEQSLRARFSAGSGASVYLGTVHRLDRPVSGVLLWAKTPKAARRLAEQFAGREAQKEYWAIVEDSPASPGPIWDDWLCRDDSGGGRYARICPEGTDRAKKALTEVEAGVAGRVPGGCTFLRLRPETGRTHQLRIQAASRGMPILGDLVYDAAGAFPSGIALHARRLTIRHPIGGQSMEFLANLPDAWRTAGIEIDQE